MKRSAIHGFFMIVAAGLLALTLWHAYQLYDNQSTLAAIAAVPRSLSEQPASVQSTRPEVLLAQASALSAGGQLEAAETLFVKLIDQHSQLSVGRAARFNLANHYLRQGMRQDLSGAQTRTLLETAKQRYRDLLQADSLDWDARYNLERALRLAPEIVEHQNTAGPPPKRVRVIVPDFKLKNLP